MLLAIDAGNTNLVFALLAGWRDQGAVADRHRPAAHRRSICSLAAPIARARRLYQGRRRRGDHRHGGAARAPQPRSAGQQIFPCRTADCWAGRGGLADRARRRRAAERRRRPRAQRHRRPRQISRRPGRDRLRHRDDVRRGRFLGRLQGRDHRAGDQPVARRPGQRGGDASPNRDRGAGRDQRHRPDHREPDADRHLLGLCRDDRRAGRAHEGARSDGRSRSSPPAGSPTCSTSTPMRSTRSSPTSRSRGWACSTKARPNR